MRGGNALLLGLFIAIVQPVDLWAQAVDGNQMQAFTNSNFYKGLITRAIAAVPQTVFQRCSGLISNGSTVTIVKPVSFGANGYPNGGVWKQTFPVSGCGNDTTLNFYFIAAADGKINTIGGIPGATHADLILQRDAVKYANIGAALVVKDCKVFDVKNTHFDGFGLSKPPMPDPGPDSRFRPWREIWTMIGCGSTVEVPIGFVPDEKGTQIIQSGGVVER